MERFICIHGHFYQPPRENPWLEAIEIQDSAYPYHDWNERITAECYAPNTAARNLDSEGRIMGIISNYARISFNSGPTLLSWMEKYAPGTYRAILAADRQSIAWRTGHGAALALAQVYNHLIMPLASQYAGRAMQLAERCCRQVLKDSFLERLAPATSNIPEQGNGAEIFARFADPAMIGLIRVGAHYAVSSVFEEYGEETSIFSYNVYKEDFMMFPATQMRLALGRVFIRSSITRKADWISFCTLYFGGHALNCGVRTFLGEQACLTMKQEVLGAFNEADFAAIIRLMDTHFGMHTYSLKDLFRDEQRRVLQRIIAGTLQEFEDKFITLYESSRSLMEFLRNTGMPVPRRFMTTAETALNLELQKMFDTDAVDTERLGELVREVSEWNVAVDDVVLEFIIRRRLEGAMAALLDAPENTERMDAVLGLLESMAALSLTVNLWQTQNMYVSLLRSRELGASEGGAGDHGSWSASVRNLGRQLFFNVPAVLESTGANP